MRSSKIQFRWNGDFPKKFEILGKRPAGLFIHYKQGDHVTSYGLIEYGCRKILDQLSKEEDEFCEFRARKLTKNRRSTLFSFISSVTAVDEDNYRRSVFAQELTSIITDYNNKRHSKKKLFQDTREAKSSSDKATLLEIEKKHNQNAQFLQEVLGQMVVLILSFYNKINRSAYFPINFIKDNKSEGNNIKKALQKIGSDITFLERQFKAQKYYQNELNIAVSSIYTLFYYPQISEESKIKNMHDMSNNALKYYCFDHRDNAVENLCLSIARHLYFVFIIFNELSDVNLQNAIMKSFVNKVIDGGKDSKFGWPCFKNQKPEVIDKVQKDLDKIKNRAKEYYQQDSQQYLDIASSSDEDETPILTETEMQAIEAKKAKDQQRVEDLESFILCLAFCQKEGQIELPKDLKQQLQRLSNKEGRELS